MDAQTRYAKARAFEKKLSRAKRKRAIAALGSWLHKNYPKVFHTIRPSPLALGIEHEIHAQTEGKVSLRTIRLFLSGWVKRAVYLEAIIDHRFRVHLNGSGSEFIGRQQKKIAQAQLKEVLLRQNVRIRS
jgi:sRNA-binding protein